MINEERLARPTWEMAHLQTQVRSRPDKASACEHRQLSEAQVPPCRGGKVFPVSHVAFPRGCRQISLCHGFLRDSWGITMSPEGECPLLLVS